MQHGKDVLTDKPGMTTFAQLDEIKARAKAETGRIYSVLLFRAFRGARHRRRPANLIAAGRHRARSINTRGPGARMPDPQQPAAGLVLRSPALWRHPLRYRLATSSSSSCSSPTAMDADSASRQRSANRGNPGPSRPAGCGRRPPQDPGDHRAIFASTGSPPTGSADLGRRTPDHPGHRRLYRAAANISTLPAARAKDHLFLVNTRWSRAISTAPRVERPYRQAVPRRCPETAPRRPCRRSGASTPWKLALTAQAEGRTRDGVGSNEQDFHTLASSVAASAAAISWKAMSPIQGQASGSWPCATSMSSRMTDSLADEFGVERRIDQLRRPAGHGRSSTSSTSVRRPCLHFSDGHGRAQGRQARHLREATGRFARPGRCRHGTGKAAARRAC